MKLNKLFQTIAFSALIIGLTKCTNSEIGASKDVAQDKIYQRYDISYTEGEKDFHVKAQFRFAGSDGTTLVLSDPSFVQFDQQRMKLDSGKFVGAYYTHHQDSGLMTASHSLVFYDINKKAYENGFFMNDFMLSNVPQQVSKDQPLAINYLFEPAFTLQEDDYIRLASVNTDSSFSVTVRSTDSANTILIPAKELQRQKGKELGLEATLFRKIPLKQATPEGGVIEMLYALKPVKIKLK